MRKSLAWSAALSSLALASCAEVPTPDKAALEKAISSMPTIETAEQARGYVRAVRESMKDQQHLLGVVELTGDAAVAGGTITAVLGGALQWASKTIIQATLVAGSGVALNQAANPRVQADILDNAIGELTCIEDKTIPSKAAVANVDLILRDVISTRNKLRYDYDHLEPGEESDATLDAIKLANTFINANTPQVYEKIRIAVDGIVAATNKQMRSAVSDPNAFAAALQKLSPANPPKSSNGGAPQAATPPAPAAGASRGLRDISDSITSDITALNEAMRDATPKLAQLASIANPDFNVCIPGAVVLAIKNLPIEVAAGKAFAFTVSGGPHAWNWDGVVPQNVHLLQKGSSSYEVSADVGAAGFYSLTFTPYAPGAALTASVAVK